MRVTLADGVYESIKALIMDHAVAPGDRVSIDALARQLGVSPTPVREALARLESDGLVRKRPLAGYTTTPLLTRAEFEELFEMRLLLETAAARWAAGAGLATPATELLRKEADLPDPAAGATESPPPAFASRPKYASFAAFTAQDARFHDLLAELSGNRMLYESVIRLHSHLHLHRLDFPVTHYGVSAVEHHRVVDAVGAGDPDAAAAAMRAHLTAARQRHRAHFDRRQPCG
jgi:DNA-binding GntR family transcriptional regulator